MRHTLSNTFQYNPKNMIKVSSLLYMSYKLKLNAVNTIHRRPNDNDKKPTKIGRSVGEIEKDATRNIPVVIKTGKNICSGSHNYLRVHINKENDIKKRIQDAEPNSA